MQRAGHGQDELGDVDFERHAVLAHAMVGAAHGANRGRKRAAAGVLEAFARLQQGLLAHDSQAPDFLLLLVAVGDDPVTADQLGGFGSGVGDADGVRKDVLPLGRVGLIGQVAGLYGHREFMRFHACAIGI